MNWLWLLPVPVVLGVIVMWRPLRLFSREVQFERAQELFKLQRERLEANFHRAATATGKPRGLIWKDIEWEDEVVLARERRSGQLAALIAITIQFEAVEGSDMEGLPAVSNLRNASAVFFFQRGHWHTVGKAIFNMNPGEAIDHFKTLYERVGV